MYPVTRHRIGQCPGHPVTCDTSGARRGVSRQPFRLSEVMAGPRDSSFQSVVNLTPHEITVMDKDDQVLVVYPPCGTLARLVSEFGAARAFGEVPLGALRFGQVDGLPEPLAGVLYLVPLLVKLTTPNRPDVAVVVNEVRDECGRIVGCRRFATDVVLVG